MSDQASHKPPIQPDEPASYASPKAHHPAQKAAIKTGDGGGLNPADEMDIWTGRTSWKHSILSILAWAVFSILVVSGGFWLRSQVQSPPPAWTGWIVVALIVLPGLYVALRVFVKVFGTRYRLTNQRIFIDRGILGKTTDQTELIRVDDVRIHKSLIDRIVGIGSVEVIGTDATDDKILVTGVESPDTIAEYVRTNMRILRQRSLYVESL